MIRYEIDLSELSVQGAMKHLVKRGASTTCVTPISIPQFLNFHSLLLRSVFLCGGQTFPGKGTRLHRIDSTCRLETAAVAGGLGAVS